MECALRRLSRMSRLPMLLLGVALSVLVMMPRIATAGAVGIPYTVTFYENDSPSDTVKTPQASTTAADLTLVADLGFSNPGYTFAGWSDSPTGSISYTDGEQYSFTANINLYAQWTPISVPYTVTFYENDSPSDTVKTPQASTTAADLTLVADLGFSNPGYTFAGWSESPTGSISYTDGEQYSFTANINLYAQWTSVSPSETITFSANGGTGSISSMTETSGDDITLPSGSTLSLAGSTFVGWNTAANGTGTEYLAGQSLDVATTETLYAQWTSVSPSETITFSANGGTGSISSMTETSGDDITLPSGSSLSLAGSTFVGWNTAANGTGTEYAAGQTIDVGATETLYAQWAAADQLVEITIDANGVDATMSPISGIAGSVVTLPSATSIEDPGSTLTSWNTEANGSGISYAPGQTLILSASMTLYAQWTPATSVVLSVDFEANGGSDSLKALSGAAGSSITLPSSLSVVRDGYELTSWNTEADGKGTTYALGATITLSSSLTLYAQWSPIKVVTSLYGAIGDFAKDSSKLTVKLERQIRTFATVLKKKKYTDVKLYGYTAATGVAALNKSLSDARAVRVANYLRVELRTMKVTGVTITAAGEGSVAGKTSSIYSLVEVFVS